MINFLVNVNHYLPAELKGSNTLKLEVYLRTDVSRTDHNSGVNYMSNLFRIFSSTGRIDMAKDQRVKVNGSCKSLSAIS